MIQAPLAAASLLLALVDATPVDPGQADAGAALSEDASATQNKPSLAVSAHLEPDKVALGQPFDLVVEVHRAPGQRLLIPEALSTKTVELLQPPVRSMAEKEGKIVELIRFRFAAFALKDVRTPEIKLQTGDGETYEVLPLPVQVQRGLAKEQVEQGLADPVQPIALTRFDKRPVAIAISLAVFLLTLLFFAWLNHRRGPAPAPLKKVSLEPPPHLVALKRLKELERSALVQRAELDRFVSEVTAILRWYLGKRYQIDALDMTTSELHQALLGVLDPGLDAHQVGAILRDADMVKFARASTTAQACAQIIEAIRSLIHATKATTKEAA